MQLDLFELTPPSSSPLTGQHVQLDRTCRCGSNIAIAGPACRMHAARLSCANCGAFVGWLPRATARWLINVVTRFGAPSSSSPIASGATPMLERTITLPKRGRGRPDADASAQYERDLEAFCRRLTEIDSGLDFKVSARGWAYILKEHGLTKGDFDVSERLITDCRK